MRERIAAVEKMNFTISGKRIANVSLPGRGYNRLT
jgi:hypothetical protein